MKLTFATLTAAFAALASAAPAPSTEHASSDGQLAKRAEVQGHDVSHYQSISASQWKTYYNNGARFVWIKATEGTTYTDPSFSSHYSGATNAGYIRGGYHFAHPTAGGGAAQANFFLSNGGGWSGDGRTLPGALDLEAGSSGTCWGLTQAQMRTFISDFGTTYKGKTGRYPVLYLTNSWWDSCIGSTSLFKDYPTWIARYNSVLGTTPASQYVSFWQYSDSQTPYPGDEDKFFGTLDQLKTFASS